MVLKIMSKSKVTGEPPTVIYSDAMDTLVVRIHADELPGSVFSLQTGSVQLPDDLTEILAGAGDFVDVEVRVTCCTSEQNLESVLTESFE